MNRTLCCFLLALALSAPAVPAWPNRIDTDGDGRYSLAELRALYPTLTEGAFERIDQNSDGWVTPGEFRAGQDQGLLPATTRG